MQVTLQNIKPDFLEEEKIGRSEIWNKHINISRGEKIQVIAPSGSGKTSFIHFLYGLRKDYHGTITIDNKHLDKSDVEDFSALRSSKISIVFQDLRLFPDHSVFDNINVKRRLQPYHGEEKIKEMAARLGIAGKLSKTVRTCSYGEQQRVAIIRALQQPFELLLMDEPFSNLDESNRIKAMELINEEADQRKATIILADLKKLDFFQSTRMIQL